MPLQAPISPFANRGQPLESYSREVMKFSDLSDFRPPGEWLEVDAGPCLPQPMSSQPRGVLLGVDALRRHMTDEAWQLQQGVEQAGFIACGRGLTFNETDCRKILSVHAPDVALIQDRREWGPGSWHPEAAFRSVTDLAWARDVVRATVFKDVGSDQVGQYAHHKTLRPHLYVIYSSAEMLKSLAPWVPARRCIRTYHSVDANAVPAFSADRLNTVLLSGAVDPEFYPLRAAAARWIAQGKLTGVKHLEHPGYHDQGSITPAFLQTLSRYKVHLATASAYGFCLRKIIESVVCGCTCVTTLPAEDEIPAIDPALFRIPHNVTCRELQEILDVTVADWDPERAEHYAKIALDRFHYSHIYATLADELYNAVYRHDL